MRSCAFPRPGRASHASSPPLGSDENSRPGANSPGNRIPRPLMQAPTKANIAIRPCLISLCRNQAIVSSLPSSDKPRGSNIFPPTSTVLGVDKISSRVNSKDEETMPVCDTGAKADAEARQRDSKAQVFMVGAGVVLVVL